MTSEPRLFIEAPLAEAAAPHRLPRLQPGDGAGALAGRGELDSAETVQAEKLAALARCGVRNAARPEAEAELEQEATG